MATVPYIKDIDKSRLHRRDVSLFMHRSVLSNHPLPIYFSSNLHISLLFIHFDEMSRMNPHLSFPSSSHDSM